MERPQKNKSGLKARRLHHRFRLDWEPGRSTTPPGPEKLLLLRFLGLLRLLRLLRFLSHSILSRFNGWKRDTRHARRRATLATSSTQFQQIRAALPRAVTPLSSRYPQLL